MVIKKGLCDLSYCMQPNTTFCLVLYKDICCEYPFELHQLVDVIQMSTHNICLYEENQKKKKPTKTSHKHRLMSPLLIFFFLFFFFLSVPLV